MTCSTSYVARLIIHRYAMLGILDEHGYPVKQMCVRVILYRLASRHPVSQHASAITERARHA